jgi:hypothetical protein
VAVSQHVLNSQNRHFAHTAVSNVSLTYSSFAERFAAVGTLNSFS